MDNQYEFSKRSKGRMQGVHPELALIFQEALKVSPIDFGIPGDGGVRTAERQNEMYLDPDISTNCDGYGKQSNHQVRDGEKYGMALDFYAYINGAASWKSHHLSMVVGVIMSTARRLRDEGKVKIRLTWGGTFGSNDFTGWDQCHIEGYFA